MKLYLLPGYAKPKAVLDDLFVTKEQIFNYCLRLAKYVKHEPLWIPLTRHHTTTDVVRSHVRRYYWHMTKSIAFDKRFCKYIWERGTQQIEEYRMLQLDSEAITYANESADRPRFLSPPLFYKNNKIDTLYSEKFYGRIETDLFGQDVIVMRSGGEEKFFTTLEQRRPYPIFTQPFAVMNSSETAFFQHDTTFLDTFMTFKGLFNIWYGFTFKT